jgi:hypothetical protein
VYQGIKPAVIVLTSPDEGLKQHVRVKQELLLDKMKSKRAAEIKLEV